MDLDVIKVECIVLMVLDRWNRVGTAGGIYTNPSLNPFDSDLRMSHQHTRLAYHM